MPTLTPRNPLVEAPDTEVRGTSIFDLRPRFAGHKHIGAPGTEIKVHGRIWHRHPAGYWINTANFHDTKSDTEVNKITDRDGYQYLGRQIGWTPDPTAADWFKNQGASIGFYRKSAGIPIFALTHLAPSDFLFAIEHGLAVPTPDLAVQLYAEISARTDRTTYLDRQTPEERYFAPSPLDLGYRTVLNEEFYKQNLRVVAIAPAIGMDERTLKDLLDGDARPYRDELEKLSPVIGLTLETMTARAQEFADSWGKK